jgi:tripartite ATP-independent transporter DctM subunit
MTPVQAGILGLILLVVLLFSGLPVAFTMAIVGAAGYAYMVSFSASSYMVSADIFDNFTSYTLTVIPLFVFMGQIAFHSGISRRLFDATYKWIGHWPGGMAMATVGACTAFGAICGSGPATAATMAAVALPEMKRYGYDMKLATGTIAAGGGLGMMIPPSVVFIVYAILTEQSIGKLFISGILPGLMIAGLFCLTIYWQCKRNPAIGPAGPRFGPREKLFALLGVTETVILFVGVMGGMFAGWFTPTEAAAIGALGSLIIAAFRKKLTFKMVSQSLRETIRTSCMVIIIVTGAVIFGHFLAITQLPSNIAETTAALPLPAWAIMALILLFYIVSGCFVDALALVFLTTPIFYPVVLELGFDPIWFGVMIVLVTQIGVITPPVGVNVYVVSGMERDIPLHAIFKGAVPFVWALVVSAILLIMFPQIATFLPEFF